MINLECTHFLNGPYSKIVGFIDFNGNHLKMMNVPYFISSIGKRLDKKGKVNFKIYDVTMRSTENYNKHIPKHLKHI